MDNNVGGLGNGGFHGYHTFPSTPEMRMGVPVPVHLNQDSECTIREQDRFMPIANVMRIMRRILPPHAKISDDSKQTIQECVSEFISFVTGEANERCQCEQRKTITAEDLLWAMSKLGFDDYIEPLTFYLHRYREIDGGEHGALTEESAMLKLDPQYAGYFVYPLPMANTTCMQGDGITSQCAVESDDSLFLC
ncbi:nuclear transcription factor Y subunit B-6 isoform X2 [Solanum pennellii]|uniref:Nuclear transcription factor Y subunit B-6 isoform X2 n=1 Tax=Solanum pennellii TaxID=28526 RepID=A0ABM1FK86_SOLPN|nr:nuclear transcription factor Y subunit B-6 isoform X2 [Solanum pennellii]